MTTAANNARRFEITIDVAAPIEHVWRALTDAQELMRWFPPVARATPGKGGSIFYSWGPELASDCRIHVWEPPHHLRVDWIEHSADADAVAKAGGAPVRLAVDYELTARSGSTTTLRLVHSGFGAGREWDGVYDDISHGWPIELRSLRHYLERHRGEDRRIIWLRAPIDGDRAEAWRRLLGARGLVKQGAIGAAEGDRFAITTAAGDAFEGAVVTHNPGREFSGTVDSFHNSLLRIALESCFGRPEAWIWLSTWGAPGAQVDALESRLRSLLSTLFPEPAGARAAT